MKVLFSDNDIVLHGFSFEGGAISLTLATGGHCCDFNVRFETISGIKVMLGGDPLVRWLTGCDKLSALPFVRRVADEINSGLTPELPLTIAEPWS